MDTNRRPRATKNANGDLPVAGRKASRVRGGYVGIYAAMAQTLQQYGTKSQETSSAGGGCDDDFGCGGNHNETLLRG